ncbi:MAG: Rne/Rng family ribonuclease [Alphaproteobacteria bacterium]
MSKRMLIDATHNEETRVVVVDGKKLEEFDFETSTKKQLKGNIYLAKITRVEPSLQAAFVDYGGNRHGFLAFSEIHPDYYEIPVSDREALIAQQRRDDESSHESDPAPKDAAPADSDSGDQETESETETGSEKAETVSGAEEEEIARRPATLPRYRIQEVIKRRQILLVQVTKEERGNKGAALTSYISLAGRYCVLMPNTTRGGGISRKIQSGEARKRLKSVVSSLAIAEGMAVILRTAGQERTKAEIKRDYDYLVRLWDDIREKTLVSSAPQLVHEKANLIRRSIRDLYSSTIEEVLVDGDEGYKIAKRFMRTLMPSHAKRVQPYRDRLPLFTRYQVDSQFDAMHSPVVQLRSGGYIVINPTEALVAIDVNSGRATKERNIEETAKVTNLEAAEEVARQLRLRDLAGLIVIDFIDMEENRNIRSVERRLKDAVHSDRARIQMGRISSFGLLELSRQRLRPSILEVSSGDCEHCAGTGKVRSVESSALHTLRAIEEEGVRGRASVISATVPTPVALYLINNKREALVDIESRARFRVVINTDDSPAPPECRIEMLEAKSTDERAQDDSEIAALEENRQPVETETPEAKSEDEPRRHRRGRRRRGGEDCENDTAEDASIAPAETPEVAAETAPSPDTTATENEAGGPDGERTRRRRRGRRGGRKRSRARAAAQAQETDQDAGDIVESGDAQVDSGGAQDAEAIEVATPVEPDAQASDPGAGDSVEGEIVKPKRRRRTRKPAAKADSDAAVASPDSSENGAAADDAEASGEPVEPANPARRRRTARRPRAAAKSVETVGTAETAETGNAANEPEPSNGGRAVAENPVDGPASVTQDARPDSNEPRRRGWWQKITGA